MSKIEHFPAHLHGSELKEFLELHADSAHEGEYVRPLSPDEITTHKSEYVDAGLEKSTLEDEMKEIRKQFKSKIDAIKERFKHHGQCIRRKAIETTGVIYAFKDFEEGRVYEYTEHGQLITDRRMNPDDRQKSIDFKPSKTA